MIGRKDGLMVKRSGRCGFRETILAGSLGAILCAGPVVAQTEPPAPQAQPAAPLPVGAAPVSPPMAPASTGLAGATPAGQSAAPPAEASNPPPRFTDALLPSSHAASENVFKGDSGDTQPTTLPTRRIGIEWTNDYRRRGP
jgi:hypothetical protein